MRGLADSFNPLRWTPPPELLDSYRISQFMLREGISDFRTLAKRAAEDPRWYYPAAFDFVGAEWLSAPTEVVDRIDAHPFAKWFPGGRVNVAWTAVERWVEADRAALIWHSEDGECLSLTFRQVADQVRTADAGLRALGVVKGDLVAIHLPPIPEAVVLMLALGRMGAIGVPVFSGYGVDPLRERLELSGAKVLVTADGSLRRGQRVAMLPTALAAAEGVDTVREIVVVERLGDPLPRGSKAISWRQMCDVAPQIEWDEHAGDDPWMVMYTSGSTGRPKGAVLTQGNFTFSLMAELAFQADVKPGDRYCWPADMGWMAGPAYCTVPLMLGACAVIVEGVMTYPDPDRVWKLVDRFGITQMGFGPTVARQFAELGEQWVAPHGLDSLRTIPSGGEPWTEPAWKWVHRYVGRGWAPIINWCGGTEVGGSMVSGFPNVTTEAMRFAGPVLGVDVDVVDAEGTAVVEQEGEIVMRRTTPAVTPGFWGEPDRYVDSYWRTLPGLWVHGDRAIRHADGSFSVLGRSDDLMKIAGKRVGPVELEGIVLRLPGVTSAAAIGISDPEKGEVAVLVIAAQGLESRNAELLRQAVSDRIASRFGKPMRPKAVLIVSELPRTRSGKIHRRFLRAWLNGSQPGDATSLENPHVRDEIVEAGFAAGLLAGSATSVSQ